MQPPSYASTVPSPPAPSPHPTASQKYTHPNWRCNLSAVHPLPLQGFATLIGVLGPWTVVYNWRTILRRSHMSETRTPVANLVCNLRVGWWCGGAVQQHCMWSRLSLESVHEVCLLRGVVVALNDFMGPVKQMEPRYNACATLV
jgi:hypothetical protein